MATNCSSKDWLDYISAVTPILVAFFVAYIAYRQWRIAQQKLRLDLYNKRFAVFEITLRLFQEILGGTSLAAEQFDSLHREFITAMIEAKFLFDTESGINEMMNEFNKATFFIKGGRDIMKTSGVPPEVLIDASNRMLDEQKKLPAKLEAMEKAMAPYLSFRGQVA
jgi:hypothetical protein